MAKIHSNGTGKKMPVLTTDIALDGDYEGYVVTVRTNPRFGTKLDMSSGDDERFVRAVQAIMLRWNVCDEDGNALLSPHEVEHELAKVESEIQSALRERDSLLRETEPDKAALEASEQLIIGLTDKRDAIEAQGVKGVPDELLSQLLGKYVNRSTRDTEVPKD